MIHVITLEDTESLVVDQLCGRLFLAFGIGCEYAGQATAPTAARQGDDFEVVTLLQRAPVVESFADDKLLYLVSAGLRLPEGPLGAAPSFGFADPTTGRGVVSSAGLNPPPGEVTDATEEGWVDFADRISRRAVQQMGFLWGLHRCVDVRCSMYIPWSPRVDDANAHDNATLCDFCREKSEVGLHRARS